MTFFETLEALELHNCTHAGTFIETLAKNALNVLSRLNYLVVIDCDFNDETLKAISENTSISQLIVLSVVNSLALTNDGFKCLESAEHLKSLKVLIFRNTDLRKEGIESLVRSHILKSLICLDLSHNHLEDASIDILLSN